MNNKIEAENLPLRENVPLWEIFPDYTLSPDLGADDCLKATLKECYAPEAVFLRGLFLVEAGWQMKSQNPAAEDLIQNVGPLFEAHLKNYDSSIFHRGGGDSSACVVTLRSPMVAAEIFKPRATFSDREWQTMAALLSGAWEWAQRQRLNHYT